METLVLIGGFAFVVIVGYFATGRLGRFWDEGGISPYWDEEEERAATRGASAQSNAPKEKDCCGASALNKL